MKKSLLLLLLTIIMISCTDESEIIIDNNQDLTLISTPASTSKPEPTPTLVTEITPTPEISSTSTSTPIPEIISTPTPTPTPLPTATPTPMPTATPIPEEIINQNDIKISGFKFLTNEISINVGTTIIWTNNDSSIHTATSIDSKFDSGYLYQNESYEFKFLNAGVYTYRCSLHSGMIGKISVFAENGLLIDPTPTPSPTSTPTPQGYNQGDQISPPSSGSSSYY